MHPTYRMDSFPHQRNQMPFVQHRYPSFEAIPPQMTMGMLRSPITHETWPYGGNYYGHSIPMGCHGCCNHSFFPGCCGFRPPCSHYPPPSTLHGHGGYPSFPETYPVYFVRPHNSTEQPRYEYEKNVPRDHHCCGCPNHPCSRKEDSRVKIEEQEPDNEKKSNNALVPVEFQNQPYPVVWIPPGYLENRDQRDPAEKELKERVEYPCDTRADEELKPSEQEPNVWSGWYPFNINSLGSMKHGGDGNGSQNLPNEDNNRSPFPVVWMPYNPEEKKTREQKEASPGPESAERPPSNLKDTSANFLWSDDSMSQSRASEEKFGSEVASKMTEKKIPNQKIIPVIQLEEHENKRLIEEAKGKPNGITEKEIEDSREKKLSENDGKRQSPFPLKKSKLPPVCLRVDPLPKRKNGGGKSRSPSPPSHERKSQKLSVEGSKSTLVEGKETLQDIQSSRCMPNKTKEAELNGSKGKMVEVMNGITRQDNVADCKDQSQHQVCLSFPIDPNEKHSKSEKSTGKAITGDVVSRDERDEKVREKENKSTEAIESKDEAIKVQPGDEQLQTQNVIGASEVEKQNPVEAKEAKRKNLSEAEAAVVIQSAYRGFEVRKWEATKKLKQIAEIRKQMCEVRSRIEALEASIDVSSDNREMVVLGETVMSLLLKLDTIQGLHPIVRDFRKSVAKELVSLQEKLDFLTATKFEMSSTKLSGDCSMNIRENASIRGHREEAEQGHGNIIVGGYHHNKSGSVEMLSTPGSQDVEASKLELIDKEECEESEDRITTSPLRGKAEAEPINELEDGLNNEVLVDGRLVVSKTESNDLELKVPVEPLPLVPGEKIDSVVVVTVPSCPGEAEFPDVYSHELAVEKQIETGKSKVLHHDQVKSLLATDSANSEAADINEVHQPLGVLEEETVAPSMKGVRRESNLELHQDDTIKQQEEAKAEEEKVSNIHDSAGTTNLQFEANVEAKSSLKENDPSEATGFERLTQGDDGVLNDMVNMFKLRESQPSPSLALEIQDEGGYKPEEFHPELSLTENENHGGKASKPEIIQPGLSLAEHEKLVEAQPELLSAHSEILGGEQKEDMEMVNDEDNYLKESDVPTMEFVLGGEASKPGELQPELSPAQDEIHVETGDGGDVRIEETKESEREFKEENQEFGTPEALEAVRAGNDKVIEQPYESKIINEKTVVGIEFAPASADRPEVEEELVLVSPTASQVSLASEKGSKSDWKLLEENEKLREMMQKLLEAGNEQLTAISNLSVRVKDLEKKLARKRKLRTRRVRGGASCVQPSNNSLKGSAQKITV